MFILLEERLHAKFRGIHAYSDDMLERVNAAVDAHKQLMKQYGPQSSRGFRQIYHVKHKEQASPQDGYQVVGDILQVA